MSLPGASQTPISICTIETQLTNVNPGAACGCKDSPRAESLGRRAGSSRKPARSPPPGSPRAHRLHRQPRAASRCGDGRGAQGRGGLGQALAPAGPSGRTTSGVSEVACKTGRWEVHSNEGNQHTTEPRILSAGPENNQRPQNPLAPLPPRVPPPRPRDPRTRRTPGETPAGPPGATRRKVTRTAPAPQPPGRGRGEEGEGRPPASLPCTYQSQPAAPGSRIRNQP